MAVSVNAASCAGSGLVFVFDLVALFAQGVYKPLTFVCRFDHPTAPSGGFGKPVVDFGNSKYSKFGQ
jgi:hypothetical protein